MSPYKNLADSAKAYLNSVPLLKFILSAHVFVFGLGGLLYLLGVFIPITAFFLYDFLTCIGRILLFAGLILTVIKEDVMSLVITSGVMSIGSLIAWIVKLVAGYSTYYFSIGIFLFEPLLYFLIFGAITVFVMMKSEKFKQMRAASVAKPQGAVACPRCGGGIPVNAAFCPSCGEKNPAAQSYAPPQQSQQPPVQPQQPPVQPQQPPMQPQQPPMQPQQPPVQQQQPPVQEQPVQQEQPPEPVQNEEESSAQPEAAEQNEPAAPESAKCVQCGADIAPGAKFCGICGAKQ